MKGFEASTWVLPGVYSTTDHRWYTHKKFKFLKISCRKISKGLKSSDYPKRDPTWSLEVIPWSTPQRVRYKREFQSRFNTKLLEKFFDDMIKSSVGKHIILNYIFEGKLQ